MTKHTSGPWVKKRFDIISHQGNSIDIEDEEGNGIALCYDCKNVEANANLIASAPELLEACKKLDKWWRLPNDKRTITSIEPVVIKTLQAISHAEGGDK